ncbi:MAG TPA: tetratricopeptide repeat protein, partial [Candidatus Brocadiales bacterium]|nr:tetratricopeptide repeat protein [Candidatus Brocadiales bacterium]
LYRKRNENNKAIEALQKALEIDSNYYPAYVLADIYFIQGRVDESINLYRKASNLSGKNLTPLINLAIACQRKGDYNAAFEACQQAIGLQTQNVVLYYTVLTNLHISQGTYSKAITSIKEAHELADDQKALLLRFIDTCQSNEDRGREASLSLNQAILCGNSGMYDLAIAQCKEAASSLRLHPKDGGQASQEIMTRWVMANLYLSSGQLADAVETYNEIIKIEPNSASLYTELGNVYLLLKKLQDAKDAYQKAIGINAMVVPALLALSNLYMQEGLYSDAIKMSEQAHSHDPKSLTARGILAECYLSMGKYEDAEGYLKEMLKADPLSYQAHRMLARVKFAMKQFDKCIEECMLCLQGHPEDVQLHNLSGLAYARKGDAKAALAELGKIIDIDANFVPAYIELGNLNLFTGQPKVAAELYKKALSINNEAIAARYGLGNAYAQMGLHNQAIETFNTILKDRPGDVNSYIS